jgi:hypothetical protein
MWHEQVFCGFGGGASVFDSRPHMTTVKGMMINTAHRYPLRDEDPNSEFTRENHGWGMVDLEKLYDLRDKLFIVDETQLLDLDPTTESPAQMDYTVVVDPDEERLNVTLVYADPAAPALCDPCTLNDLNLRVESPTGDVYWGNCGLLDSNASSTDCDSPNHPYPSDPDEEIKDTVENVLITDPAAGEWTIRVSADDICADPDTCDGHVVYVNNDPTQCCVDPETCIVTSPVDVDFALVVSGVSGKRACCPSGFGACENKTRAKCEQAGGLFFCPYKCETLPGHCPSQHGPQGGG